jgi:single-strand DNA-binding protein
MINKAIIVGRLGKDPELNQGDGYAILNFTVATTESWKDRDGNKKEKTEWHNVSVMNEKQAVALNNFLKKGALVYVEGKMRTRSYEDQSGNKRYSFSVQVEYGGSVQVLSSRSDSENQGGGQQRQPQPQNSTPSGPDLNVEDPDDLPF